MTNGHDSIYEKKDSYVCDKGCGIITACTLCGIIVIGLTGYTAYQHFKKRGASTGHSRAEQGLLVTGTTSDNGGADSPKCPHSFRKCQCRK